jgi:signal peptidase II
VRKGVFISLVVSIVVFLDILTKGFIVAKVMSYEKVEIFPFLNIVHVENKGAAFGILSGLGNNIFIFISFIAIIFIVIYLLKIQKRLEIFSLSLVLGGAIGNLIDRMRIGKVIDFIDIYINNWHWPAFNVADSALTVGIIIFILTNLTYKRHTKKNRLK